MNEMTLPLTMSTAGHAILFALLVLLVTEPPPWQPAVKGGKEVPNPFKRGEMMITKSKPARNVVKALPLKNLKDMVK